jgi:hypothetical protein
MKVATMVCCASRVVAHIKTIFSPYGKSRGIIVAVERAKAQIVSCRLSRNTNPY